MLFLLHALKLLNPNLTMETICTFRDTFFPLWDKFSVQVVPFD